LREFQPELKIYTNDEIPSAYVHQIRSFIRIEWWDSYQYDLNPSLGKTDYDPVHFVLVEGECLYSALKVNRKLIEHQGQTYVCYGLGGVFTYPAFRKRGYGAWIVREATQYIQAQDDADIAVLWTADHNITFYERQGWTHTPQIKMLLGDPISPYSSSENVLMIFISDKATANRDQFEAYPVYFGKHGW